MTNTVIRTKAGTIRRQLAALTASQTDAVNVACWTRLCAARLESGSDRVAATLTTAMDAIEAEMIRRGMTTDEFSALFLATCAAANAR